jgi:hypothetical protein
MFDLTINIMDRKLAKKNTCMFLIFYVKVQVLPSELQEGNPWL